MLQRCTLKGERAAYSVKETVINIYVGNLSRRATEDDLRSAFSPFGTVASAAVIKDKFTGDSRGFGFVEMPVEGEAQAAMQALHGSEHMGRTLTVNEARPRTDAPRGNFDRPRRNNGGNFGGGGGGRRF